MASRYSVAVKSCKVVVRAQNPDAKQVLWGWAEGQTGAAAELYGRGTQRGVGDHEVWEWKLSRAGVSELLRSLALQLSDKRYRGSRSEQGAARDLAKKVGKAASKLDRCSFDGYRRK